MLYTETVEPGAMELLKELCSMREIEKFALVGGTNLALRFGHRISEDMDFFSIEKFNERELDSVIKKKFSDVRITNEADQTRQYYINGRKAEFIRFNYPLLSGVENVGGIRMYSLQDTMAAKLNAVVGRGNKKDFYDVYEFLKTRSVREMVSYYEKRFDQPNAVPLIKSLTYFEDAEKGENPKTLNNTKWEEVKRVIDNKVKDYLMGVVEIKQKKKNNY
ncbi:MAG: nucleotidyl transferase AbiEii/AbiGii toxin family protein [Cytophagales bacterium]|nr:nucleotidyl transferase AbiEii/AbiGii toxin family protein [Cytophagales bacterium]